MMWSLKESKGGLMLKKRNDLLKGTFAHFIVDNKTQQTTAMERRKKKEERKKK